MEMDYVQDLTDLRKTKKQQWEWQFVEKKSIKDCLNKNKIFEK